MTKRDGDKLRQMRRDLRAMELEYDPNSLTAQDLRRVQNAIECATAGKPFRLSVGRLQLCEQGTTLVFPVAA